VLEVQLGVLKEGTRVLIIDDLLATGGKKFIYISYF